MKTFIVSFFHVTVLFAVTWLSAVPASFARNDIVRVTDNIANPIYPTHQIIIFPDEGGRGLGSLQLRCENNKTEAYLSTDGVYGYDGVIRLRWQGMDAARRKSGSPATTLDAVFLRGPVEFVIRLFKEGSVIAEVEGYNVRGAARFALDRPTFDAIEALAQACEWEHRLPARAAASEANVGNIENDQELETSLRRTLKQHEDTLRALGRERVIELMDQNLGNW